MVTLWKIITLLIVLIKSVLGSNILYVSPIASPSHHIWNKALVTGLLQKGHNITMLSHEIEKEPLAKNFTFIRLEGLYEMIHDTYDLQEFGEMSILDSILVMYDFALYACQLDYNATGFRTLLDYPADYKFDAVIFDATFGRCFYPLIERFHYPPAVAVTPFLLPPVLGSVFGNHRHTSYMPYHSTKYTSKMNFGERILNFFYTYVEIFYHKYIFSPREDEIIREKFKDQASSPDELERHIGLLLANTDPVLEHPEALPPNIIPVGGLHARPSNPLPEDLQKIADEAKDGIILFSLGTNVRSDQLDLTTRRALLEAFSKFPQTVLWKFETDTIEDLPKNVIVRKWLPQNDILGHPNTQLFINHGGALSTQEAMYHGIPVIGIPFFVDQYTNILKMEEKKIAKYLDRHNLTFKNVYQVINEVLTSTMYKDNMRSLSKLYHSQPQSALERGVFWVEYVLRHGTAEHLVSVSRDIPTYQSANLDVFAVFIIIAVLVYSFLKFLVALCRFMFRSQGHEDKKKKTD